MNVLAKKTLLLLLFQLLTNISLVYSQSYESYREQMKKQYEEFKREAHTQYEDFRDRANAEYAHFMRKSWKVFKANPAIPLPKSPDPVIPSKREEQEKTPLDNPLPQGNIVPLPQPPEQAQPVGPIPVVPEKEAPSTIVFSFFSLPCSIVWNQKLMFQITSLEGDELAAIWERLSSDAYNAFLASSIELRYKLQLCDWAYFKLVEQISEEIFGSSRTNEAIFLQSYILTQSGYKIRIAKDESTQLTLLVNTDYKLYAVNYFNIDGDRFYLINSNANSLEVLSNGFKNEQPVSLRIYADQFPSQNQTIQKDFISNAYPTINVQTGVNKEVIEFYNSYPQCDWKVYAVTPLSEAIKRNIYPVLQQEVKGKSQAEAVNMLINFVQTAFEYKTDDEQFGYERPFFPDELFYYPYSDCEDRSILFSTIVRDLLKLDVVLLHYPNHLATAVRFNEDIKGDYVTVHGEKYLVCDPTYIGAPIGEAIPDFKNSVPEIIELQKINRR